MPKTTIALLKAGFSWADSSDELFPETYLRPSLDWYYFKWSSLSLPFGRAVFPPLRSLSYSHAPNSLSTLIGVGATFFKASSTLATLPL